eukprot:snap_masked-scaffold_27-processed-gene-4.41-mRNA-1 protein AED:1.00 eAED:1.00 QI:0/0/0/0/1/1/2/0/71
MEMTFNTYSGNYTIKHHELNIKLQRFRENYAKNKSDLKWKCGEECLYFEYQKRQNKGNFLGEDKIGSLGVV